MEISGSNDVKISLIEREYTDLRCEQLNEQWYCIETSDDGSAVCFSSKYM